ncbi:MAG: bifunctional nuclease family protein [bacterium]|nr:bifunctional nuclease family protein [bacterium]
MVEMQVAGIALDAKNNMPIIILRDRRGDRVLPIWVGLYEAQAILFALEGISPSRPLTHDLLKSVVENLRSEVVKVVINALRDNTYFAQITLGLNGKSVEVDSRPSDAIALALRTSTPIYVLDPVLNSSVMPTDPIDDNEVRLFKEKLKDLTVSDLD